MRRPSGALGFEVPERAVERIARGARRHRLLQAGAVEAAGDPRPHRLDRGDDQFHRFAVARIGHAFAAAAMRPSDNSATTTAASVLAPRLIVKVPAIGQRSARAVSEIGAGTFVWRSIWRRDA